MTGNAGAPAAIDVQGLVRAFGARRALDGVTVQVGSGECLAIFGPNGAGKTTLLRVLAGLLTPTQGTVRIAGIAFPGTAAVRAPIGLISHQSMLYGALTARENVMFAATLYGLDDPPDAADRALGRLGVADRADTPVRLLSRGLQQRVSIARAVVHGPRVLLADEPYSGLDAAGAAALTGVLGALRAEGAALVVVTHNVAEGLTLATHAAILALGRIVRHDAAVALDAAVYAAKYRAMFAAEHTAADAA